MGIKQLTAPPVEPVSLEEVKLHCRIDVDDDDTLINMLITTAREYCETVTGRVFVEREMMLNLDRWPRSRAIRLPRPPVISVDSVKYINDAKTTVTLVEDVYYHVDTVGEPAAIILPNSVTWPSATLYALNPIQISYTAGYPKIDGIVAVDEAIGTGNGTNKVFTVANLPVASVTAVKVAGVATTAYTINLTTGVITLNSAPTVGQAVTASYTQSDDCRTNIPAYVKSAIKLCVGNWYEHREAVLPAGHVGKELPQGVMALLWQERVFWSEDVNR